MFYKLCLSSISEVADLKQYKNVTYEVTLKTSPGTRGTQGLYLYSFRSYHLSF